MSVGAVVFGNVVGAVLFGVIGGASIGVGVVGVVDSGRSACSVVIGCFSRSFCALRRWRRRWDWFRVLSVYVDVADGRLGTLGSGRGGTLGSGVVLLFINVGSGGSLSASRDSVAVWNMSASCWRDSRLVVDSVAVELGLSSAAMRSRAAAIAASSDVAVGVLTLTGNQAMESAVRSSPWGLNVWRTLGLVWMRILVPGGAIGVRLKLNVP